MTGPVDGTQETVDYAAALTARQYFGERLSDQYRHHFHLIGSIFNATVLFSAAASLLLIFGSSEGTAPKAAALSLWVGSFGCLVCAYNGPLVNAMLIAQPPNAVDVVTPFVIGVLGFAQFAAVAPLAEGAGGAAPPAAAQLEHLTWWFAAAAAEWAVITVHMLGTIDHLRAGEADAPAELLPLMTWCGGILRRALRGSVATSLTLVVLFVALRWGPATGSLRRWQAVAGLLYVAEMVSLIVIQEQARRVMVRSVVGEAGVGPERTAVVE